MNPVRRAGPLCKIKAPREHSEFKGGHFMKISHCSIITDLNSQVSFNFGPAKGNGLLLANSSVPKSCLADVKLKYL